MDWTHRLFNRARSSRSQTLTVNQTVRLVVPVRGWLGNSFHYKSSYVLHLRAHPLRSGDEGGPALALEVES